MPVLSRFPLVVLGALALVASACDSGNAVDPPTAADVAGTYDITQLTFTPSATALTPVDVRAVLVPADTRIELFDGGQAILLFRRQGGMTQLVTGTFSVRRDELRVTFASDEGLDRVLLQRTLTFDRDGTALSLSDDATVNLEVYDPERYSGGSFRSVPGTLAVRLAPRPGA